MIRSVATSDTELIWSGLRAKRLPGDILKRALDKLKMLNRARSFEDLRNPHANGLHALKKDRLGQHAISINDQWRICFVWKDGNAYDVEITDYH